MASSARRPLGIGQVRRHPKHGVVYITGGAFYIEGRLSNHWTFRKVLKDGRLGRSDGDYGSATWPTPKGAEIRVILKKGKFKKKKSQPRVMSFCEPCKATWSSRSKTLRHGCGREGVTLSDYGRRGE